MRWRSAWARRSASTRSARAGSRPPNGSAAIVAGVRVGVSRGVVAVVAAELFGARAGLGFLILDAGQSFDTNTLYAAVVVLAAGGAALVELVKLLDRRLAPWRAPADGKE